MNFYNNSPLFLYIDPSTGSMLFAVLLGLVSTFVFAIRSIIIKLKNGVGINTKDINVEKNSLVIYSDNKRYANVFLPILEELEKRNIITKFYTMSEDDPILNNKYKNIECEYIENNARGYAKLNMINCDVCLATTPGLDVYQWKRSKKCKKYVHIFHDVTTALEYRMFGLDFYDTILTCNEIMNDEIKENCEIKEIEKKEVYVVGSTYMDELQKKYNRFHKEKKDDKICVLVAPTWGPNSLLSLYGEKLIDSLVKTDFDVVLRPHPQSLTTEKSMIDRLKNNYSNISNISWNYDNDNFEILDKADIMISDYSGVIFDYAFVFGKPIIFSNSEIKNDIYDSYFVEHEVYKYIAIKELGHEIKPIDFINIKDIIISCINSNKNVIEEIKKKMWNYQGGSIKRTVDWLENPIFDSLKYKKG